MAPSHVPSDHHPLQGQTIYTNPSYENLFPVEQYSPQPWNDQLNHHSGLVPNNSNPQSWQHNTYPPQQSYNSISQSYANQGHGYRTASPYQYGQFANHGSINNYGTAANVDPSLGGIDPAAMRQQQQSPYQMGVQNTPPQSHSNTVTPQSLQQNLAAQNPRSTASPYQIPKTTAELFAQQRAIPAISAQPVKNPEYEIPKGRKSGGFVIFDQAALAKATKSNFLNKLVTFGSEPLHLASNRTALPLHTPRQSVKDLRKAGADNKKLLAKKSPTKSLSARKNLKRETSDTSSTDDSSDDDSEYTDDEDDEPSPLPATRPDDMHEATKYDIIKATWYPHKSQPSSEKIKASLRDFWEVIDTIQKRWRIDSKAVTEAEEQKKISELPLLKRRVTDGRDLLQTALKSALEFAHPDVLYNAGKVKGFLYTCYQFLANRFKVKDFDGNLSTAILEVLARCVGTLTTELLEETKVIKALGVMKKSVNDKNKALIQQIIEGAAAGSKKAKVSSPPEVEITTESKTLKRPTAQIAGRSTIDAPAAKKLKPTESTTNGDKKITTAASTSKPALATSSQLKRPGEKVVPAAAKPRGNQVVNKPSTLFASLNAASKKPTASSTPASSAKAPTKVAVATPKEKKPTPAPAAKPAFSFAETMAQLLKPEKEQPAAPLKTEKLLPPETPEEKAKRLRKESRRHLRVSFRPDAALVEIKYFDHFPEEETGHDENFVRDAGDIGGEGHMFKQHKDMLDEDDDEDLEVEIRPWKDPSSVDFSVVDAEERKRNYQPYGGGECVPSCPEKEANIRHENSTLMVFYTHPSDIPSSPREPLEQQNQPSTSVPVTSFGPPPDFATNRAPKPSMPASAPDFSGLENIFKQFATPTANPVQPTVAQSTYTPAPTAAAAPTPDLASILSALNPGQGQAAPPAPMQFPPAQQPAAAPAVDINAIMAAIASANNTGFTQAPPPPPGWPAFPAAFAQPQSDNNTTYQSQTQTQTQTQTPSQSQPQNSQHTRSGHKRQRDDGNEGHGSNKKNRPERDRGQPYKKIACRFFQKGMCNKGDDCTYIHDLNA